MIQHIRKHLNKAMLGFTLIEIMIVVTVVGVLGTATISRIEGQQSRSRNVARKTMVNQLASAVTNFYSYNRYWPSTLDSLKPHYINTTPVDPKGLDACRLASTADGKYGYATYINGGENGEKNGFMIFAQVEKAGQGLDYGNIYILTGSSPCQDSALGGGKVDWFRVANSRCTSKPGWTSDNVPLAIHNKKPSIWKQFVLDLTQPTNVLASHTNSQCTGGNPPSRCDNDHDGYSQNISNWNYDPDDADVCTPNTRASGCPTSNRVALAGSSSTDNDGDGYKNNSPYGSTDQRNPYDYNDQDPCTPNPSHANCVAQGGSSASSGQNSKPWTNTKTNGNIDKQNHDGDAYLKGGSNPDPNDGNPCIPDPFGNNCDRDTDADGKFDSKETQSTDTDGDGTPNYQESSILDDDGDGTMDELDPNDSDPCVPATTGNGCSTNTDNNQTSDNSEGDNSDADGDGIPNYLEALNGVGSDRDGDGIADQLDNDRPQCNGVDATIYVSPVINGKRYIIGGPFDLQEYQGVINTSSNANNVIVTTDGNDTINAGNGDDIICAGNGNNTIHANNGNNIVIAGDGNDNITAGNQDDIIVAGNGNNIINPNNGTNYVSAGNGNDQINVGNQDDYIIAGDGNNIINGNNGANIIIAGNGNDQINVGNQDDYIVGGGGDDQINANGGSDFANCGAGTDTANGAESCLGCETGWQCDNTNTPPPPPPFPTTTGITLAPPPTTPWVVNCTSVITASTGDTDADGYIERIGSLADQDDADTNTGNACFPNSRVMSCSNRSNIIALYPSGTCSDNDNDGKRNDVAHNIAERDIDDQNPCVPDASSSSCISNFDVDEDGYRTNVSPSNTDLYDPDDSDPCIPLAYGPAPRDTCDYDHDGKTNNDEGAAQNVDSDTFYAYLNPDAHLLYNTLYETMIGLGVGVVAIVGDGIPDWMEPDHFNPAYHTVVNNVDPVDPDNDGVDNEHDPANNNPCIPSNFGVACDLDYDGDGVTDGNEFENTNSDGDSYPDWMESSMPNGLSTMGTNNPAGHAGDPDLDGYPNQIDPGNDNPCIPDASTQACLDYDPPEEVYTGYVLQGIDCSAKTTLQYGERAFYIWMY